MKYKIPTDYNKETDQPKPLLRKKLLKTKKKIM